MSPIKKSAEKKSLLPERVDYGEWKRHVSRLLIPKSPAGKAMEIWRQKESEYRSSIGDVEGAQTESLLESVYHLTRPQLASEIEKKRHEFAVIKISELLPALEGTIGALKATNSHLVPKDGTPPLNLSELRHLLEEAAFQSQNALQYLERPYMRHADALSHCLTFLRGLHGHQVPEADALALGRVL